MRGGRGEEELGRGRRLRLRHHGDESGKVIVPFRADGRRIKLVCLNRLGVGRVGGGTLGPLFESSNGRGLQCGGVVRRPSGGSFGSGGVAASRSARLLIRLETLVFLLLLYFPLCGPAAKRVVLVPPLAVASEGARIRGREGTIRASVRLRLAVLVLVGF